MLAETLILGASRKRKMVPIFCLVQSISLYSCAIAPLAGETNRLMNVPLNLMAEDMIA